MSKFNTTSLLLLSALALTACSKFTLTPDVEQGKNGDEAVVNSQARSESAASDMRCADNRFHTARDQQQTLGYLKPGYVLPQGKGAHDEVCEEHHKKPHHKKHHGKKIKHKKHVDSKPKADAYNKSASEAKQPVVESVKPAVAPAMEQSPVQPAPMAAPAAQSAPVSPAPVAPAIQPQVAPATQPTHAAPANSPATSAPAPVAPAAAPIVPPSAQPAPAAPVVEPAAPVKPMSFNAPDAGNAQTQASLPAHQVAVGSVNVIDFSDNDVELPVQSIATLDKVAEDLRAHSSKNVKIDSYAYLVNGNSSEARRNSLQRAIKIRKYLIDKDVAASRISVNAVEDAGARSNKVEIKLEDIRS